MWRLLSDVTGVDKCFVGVVFLVILPLFLISSVLLLPWSPSASLQSHVVLSGDSLCGRLPL